MPEVIFASDEGSDPTKKKKKKRRVKIRGYATTKQSNALNNTAWFLGGLVTGALAVVIGGVAVVQLSGDLTAISMGDAPEDKPVEQRIVKAEAIREAASFVSSRLNEVQAVSGGKSRILWEAVNPRFGDTWTWCELMPDPDGTAAQSCFRVDPLSLDYRPVTENVQLRGERVWVMQLECQTEDCIAVRESRVDENGEEIEGTESNRRSERINWYYSSQRDAHRSASAARRLLAELGSDRSPF